MELFSETIRVPTSYRKGLDIHDGDRILIENNVSYGDRLLGISVYNRNFKMENVVIRNNVVTQDKTNRLVRDDLKLDWDIHTRSRRISSN